MDNELKLEDELIIEDDIVIDDELELEDKIVIDDELELEDELIIEDDIVIDDSIEDTIVIEDEIKPKENIKEENGNILPNEQYNRSILLNFDAPVEDMEFEDDDEIESTLEIEDTIETPENKELKKSNNLRTKLRRFRNKENAIIDSLISIAQDCQKFEESYQAMYEELDVSSGQIKSLNLGELIGGSESKSFTDEVKDWSGNIVAYFSGKIQEFYSRGETYTSEDLMNEKLINININKAYNNEDIVKDLFKSATEYNAYLQFLKVYENFRQSQFMSSTKVVLDKKSIKAANKVKYFTDIERTQGYLGDIEKAENIKEICSFVKQIDLGTSSYTCGKCEEQAEYTNEFFRFVFLPYDDLNTNLAHLVPGINKCPHCGSYNFLSEQELKGLKGLYKYGKDIVFSNLKDFLKKRRYNAFGFALYTCSYEELESKLPDILIDMEDIEIKEEDYNDDLVGIVDKALERYLELKRFFMRDRHKNSEERLMESASIIEGVEDLPLMPNISLNLNKELDKYESLAKFLCGIVNVDYGDKKNQALDTLVSHIDKSKYGRFLKYSELIKFKSLRESSGILDGLSPANMPLMKSILDDCVGALGININVDKMNENNYMDYMEEVKNGFNNLDNEEKYLLNLREVYIEDLKNNIYTLGKLSILGSKISEDIKKDYLQDETLRELLDVIANRIVMNNVSEEFFDSWFPTYRGSKTGNSIRNSNYKDIKNFVGTCNSFLYTMSEIMAKMDINKGGKFKDFSNAKLSVYPDSYTKPIADLLIKTKIEMDSDEYKTIVCLNELLNEVDIPNRVISLLLERISNSAEIVANIVNTYGEERYSRLLYYFEGLFTKEEIIENYSGYMDYLKINIILDRLPGEDFDSYMKRYKDIKPEYSYKVREGKLLEELRKSYVLLDSCFIISNNILDSSLTKDMNAKTAIDVILDSLLANYDFKEIIDILGYPEPLVNVLVSRQDEHDIYDLDYNEFRNIMYLTSFIFDDLTINGDLSQVGINIKNRMSIMQDKKEFIFDIASHIKAVQKIYEYTVS